MGFRLLTLLVGNNVEFKYGEQVAETSARDAAWPPTHKF
jgi:hypothetical protein